MIYTLQLIFMGLYNVPCFIHKKTFLCVFGILSVSFCEPIYLYRRYNQPSIHIIWMEPHFLCLFLVRGTYWLHNPKCIGPAQWVLNKFRRGHTASALSDRCVMYSLHKMPWWVLSFHCCRLVIYIFINNAKTNRCSAQMNWVSAAVCLCI